MKSMKQMLSWLLVFAMVFSLVPVNPVQAEGEEDLEYDVQLQSWIEAKNGSFGEYSGEDFSLSVPEGQEGVEAGEDEWSYKVKDTFTFHITVPEGYGTDYIEVLNHGEVLEDITFESQGNNVYAVTIPVNDSMYLAVRDSSYYSVWLDQLTSSFNCYFGNTENGQLSIGVRQHDSCTFYISQYDTQSGDIDDLDITINGESISTDSLTKVADSIWSYTIAEVTQNQDIKVYEKGGTITLSVCNIPGNGYEVLDAEGTKCEITDDQVCFYTEKNGTVTFQVKGNTDALDYGLFLNEKELSATRTGENTYSYTVSDISWSAAVSFKKKYKVTSNISVIPCTEDGTPLTGYDASGVKEFYAASYETVYFKLADTAGRYKISTQAGESVTCDESKVFQFYMNEEDITITAAKQYAVTIGSQANCYVEIELTDNVEGQWDEETETLKWYTTEGITFKVFVYAEYDTEKMQVVLKGEDGTEIPINAGETSVDEDGTRTYSFTSGTFTQNAVIDVKGIYSNEPYGIYVAYDVAEFENVSMTVRDEDGNELEKIEEFDADYTYDGLKDGKTYELVLSSEIVDLTNIRAVADDENLHFEKQGNTYVADITSVRHIELGLGNKFYVDYECTDENGNGYLCLFGSEYNKNLRGFQNAGNLKFWINSDYDAYTSEHAVVTHITDSKGSEVAFTKEENVSVDDYGTKRTVYTVNIKDDITIYFEGMETCKYDVYMPIPSASDGYTISELQVSYDGGDSFVTVTGISDSKKTYKKYSGLESGVVIKFALTVPSGSATPLVSKKISDATMEDSVTSLQADSVTTNSDNSLTYTYTFSLYDTIEILATTNTKEIEVVTKNGAGYVEYDESEQRWNIYDGEEEDGRILLAYFDALPKIVDKADTDKEYDFWLGFPESYDEETGTYSWQYRLKKNSENEILTAYDSKNQPNTSLHISSGMYTLPADHYKLVVDTSCIIPYVNYISLSSEREDLTIAPIEKDGAAYTSETLGNQTYYIPDSDVFYFTVTAQEEADFDDMAIDWQYMEHEECEASEDGLTKTYKLTNIGSDADIRAAYRSNLQIKNGENVSMDTNSFYGDMWENEENEDGRTVRNLASGTAFQLDTCVEEGYDPDSIKVKHEHSGIVDTYSVYGGYAYHGRDRWCDVILYPGDNVFYVTEPKKAVYNMNLSQSTAYTIELVNGSKTTVEYGGSFSFRIKGNSGYDLSGIIVTADGQKMTPDKNGIYTISNIKSDYDIAVTGYKTSSFVVTFKDYNGNVIGKPQTVAFGKSAKAPANPKRKGYTFAGWDRSFSNVKQNLVVTATYKPILVSRIKINGDITKLAVGKSVTLKAETAPLDALNTGVTWSSSNNKYATVTAAGKVTAKKAGGGKTVTITATAKDGSGKKATYKIKIYKSAVKKIKLSAKSKSVKPGKKVTIKAKVSPSKNINKTLKWSSSNEKYATVNSKGVVTTKKAGKGKTVTITAKATDGSNKKATIKIKIKKK